MNVLRRNVDAQTVIFPEWTIKYGERVPYLALERGWRHVRPIEVPFRKSCSSNFPATSALGLNSRRTAGTPDCNWGQIEKILLIVAAMTIIPVFRTSG